MPSNPIYSNAAALADSLEAELKRLNRWCGTPLPPEKFEDMGAFGRNTMPFEQWLQFVLIPRIREIVSTAGEFPQTSNVAAYAVRNFDGDPATGHLEDLLYELDQLIESGSTPDLQPPEPPAEVPTVKLGDDLPDVILQLLDVLPQFEGDDLESQLQTYDTFLAILAPSVRPRLASLLLEAAARAGNNTTRARIEQAAQSIARGERATAPITTARP